MITRERLLAAFRSRPDLFEESENKWDYIFTHKGEGWKDAEGNGFFWPVPKLVMAHLNQYLKNAFFALNLNVPIEEGPTRQEIIGQLKLLNAACPQFSGPEANLLIAASNGQPALGGQFVTSDMWEVAFKTDDGEVIQ